MIDEIKESISAMVDNLAGSETEASTTVPGGGDLREAVPAVEGRQTAGPYIDLRGAVIFGYDEFERRVAEAQAQNARRSGWAAI